MESTTIDIADLASAIADNIEYGRMQKYGKLPKRIEYENYLVELNGMFDVDGYCETGCYVCTDATVNIEDIRIYNSEGNELDIDISVMELEDKIEDELKY